jgi:hypothetical protein
MDVGLTVIVAPAGVGVAGPGVAVAPGVAVGVAVGPPGGVRTRVTTTTLSGHPAAEKVMFCIYVPAGSPLVCGTKVVEAPGIPLVGWASNQGELSRLVQDAPFVGVTWILCGAGLGPPATPLKVTDVGTTLICPAGVQKSSL